MIFSLDFCHKLRVLWIYGYELRIYDLQIRFGFGPVSIQMSGNPALLDLPITVDQSTVCQLDFVPVIFTLVLSFNFIMVYHSVLNDNAIKEIIVNMSLI